MLLSRSTFALASFGLLCACGGSSSSPLNYEELIDVGAEIFETLDGTEFTDPTTLQSSGSATYTGAMAATATGFDNVAGELLLRVDFGTDDDFLSGSVTDIVSEAGDSIDGTLTIGNGIVDRTADTRLQYTFAADLTGRLSDDEDNYDIDGRLFGDFVGDDYDAVEGDVFGNITVASDGSVGTFDGRFIADR